MIFWSQKLYPGVANMDLERVKLGIDQKVTFLGQDHAEEKIRDNQGL